MLVGLILAAGSGSRMGSPKAIVEIDGQRLVDRAVHTFHSAGIKEVYLVLGAWVGEVSGAHIILNPDWQEGMGSSLRAGLSELLGKAEISDVLVSLVDLPGLTPQALAAVAASDAEIAMGSFGGKAGHPVKFARNHWPAIIESAVGDQGARIYLKSRESQGEIEYLILDGMGDGGDLDTPDDLVKFRNANKS